MSNSNGYLSRNLLDELDKKKEKKTTTPIVDKWQRLTATQLERQKADAETKHTQSTASQSKKATASAITKTPQQNNLEKYNAASVLSLGKGPLSETEADRLVQSGQASATVKNGQVYVSPKSATAYVPTRTPSTAKSTSAQSAPTKSRANSSTFGSSGGFGGSLTTQTVKYDNHGVYHQVKQAAEPTKFSVGKLVEGIARKGTTNAAHGMSSTLSWLEGALFAPAEALTGFDDLQEQHGLFYNWNSAIEKERESAYRNSAANIATGGTAAKVADTIGTGVVAALPQAITAFMSAGAPLGAVGAQGLEATAVAAQQSPGILNSLRGAVTGMANNPNYWTSFLRTAGESYEQAKADGASDSKASLYAMGNGLFNAAVEVGGGLETLPKELKSGPSAFGKWIWSSAQEGAEEPIQGVIERGLQNVVYGKKNPLLSASDETAVFNPATAAKEFGVGTAVGGILGGGQMAAAAAVSAVQNIGNERATLKANTQLFDHSILNDFNYARKYFIDFATKHFPRNVVNQETGRVIGISRKGLNKFLSGNILYEKYASGFYIPELIESAHKVGEAGNYHPETVDNIPTFEYYDCPIEIDGKEFNAHIRVKNTNVGDKYYGHTISEVVDIKIESPTRTSVSENRTAQLEKNRGLYRGPDLANG